MSRRRELAQQNVTASTRRTREAIADAEARIPSLTGEALARTQANLASHRRHLAECRDAQGALNDGDVPEGWA